MDSRQKLNLKRGASKRTRQAIWYCDSCERGQLGGKHTIDTGEEVFMIRKCRYCLYERVIK